MPGTDAALALGMMHVLIADDLVDHDYIARHTIGFEGLRERAADYPPERVARICGIAAETVTQLARAYGTTRPAVIRVNYGMQRHAGGGNAIRAVACLPALVGAWRDPAGGALLSSSGTYPVDVSALERPDLIRGTPRTINMSVIGDALLDENAPPIRAIYVYNSNPVAVAPESAKVAAGFAREDLFCVVHEIFRTDTADYADILLPATTQLEQAGRPHVVRPPLRAREQSVDRAAWRGQAQYRGVPPAGREHGVRRALLSRHRRRARAAGVPGRPTRGRPASAGMN